MVSNNIQNSKITIIKFIYYKLFQVFRTRNTHIFKLIDLHVTAKSLIAFIPEYHVNLFHTIGKSISKYDFSKLNIFVDQQ